MPEYTVFDVTDAHLVAYRPGHTCYGAAMAALEGDEIARMIVADHLTEFGEETVDDFAVGQEVFIETVTLYYVGRVTGRSGPFIHMEDVSWVHWTGRKSTLARMRKFTGFRTGEQRPRTEYVGRWSVSIHSIVSYGPGPWELPKESLT